MQLLRVWKNTMKKKIGRSKGVTVLLKHGQRLPEQYEISIQNRTFRRCLYRFAGRKHRMNTVMRDMKHWGRIWLESMGITAALALGVSYHSGNKKSGQ